jgi:putative (di)nucleoside polyphosphate hydrolase
MTRQPSPSAQPAAGLPYRPCVGAAILNRDGLVWIGRRADHDAEGEGKGRWWQMPQGGLDPGEDPKAAVFREVYEETNLTRLRLLTEAPGWLTYDLPPQLVPQSWGGRYRGQTQKWFALRFEGEDSEIDIARPGGGQHKPEFSAWRWERLERVPELIVDFKREVYRKVVAAFHDLAKP